MESIDIVAAGDVYPNSNFVSDDDIKELTFENLSGEIGLYRGRTTEGILIITNYRLHYSQGTTYINIPLMLIEYLETKETILYIYCKDGRSFRCLFENAEDALKWYRRITAKPPEKLECCFAFRYLSYMRDDKKDHLVFQTEHEIISLEKAIKPVEEDAFMTEVVRLGFDTDRHWRISKVNENYKFCSSYPRFLVVPSTITDDELQQASNYRCSKRIPAVVWRHQQNGCVIARSSQPKMGILNWWRSPEDEKLIESLFEVSVMNNPNEESRSKKKLLIIDARSYTAAVTNRAKGGGYECENYYPKCEVQYMGMANIHVIRTSFTCLRALCATPEDPNWLSSLEKTMWLQHILGILRSALVVVDAVEIEERPVLVHCSDGWDRTPQIVSLAKIMLDPYYRTKKGFRVLVEREWLEFGHKFGDRCGHPDNTSAPTERCPVFLQWLDCVHQLLNQYPCHFEFNKHYLVRLTLYTYSCLFGTFLLNTDSSRNDHSIRTRAFSVWPVLQNTNQFHNFLYNHSTEILRPSFHLRSLVFWSDVYLSNSATKSSIILPPTDEGIQSKNENSLTKTNLVKTKSCDDIQRCDHSFSMQRRNSDPSIIENSFTEQPTKTLYPPVPNDSISSLLIDSTLLNGDNSEVSSDGDNTIVQPSCNNDEDDLENSRNTLSSNLERAVHSGGGSTDTLVSESGLLQHRDTRMVSVATDTADLSLGIKDVLQIVRASDDPQLAEWYEHYMSSKQVQSASSTCSYDTPNQSHTPSSGFPATPNDDPGDILNVETPSMRVFRCDGIEFAEDAVQEMLTKIIVHYKHKSENLEREMRKAKIELFEHMVGRQYQDKTDQDDASVADSASSCDNRAESVNSESSWENICHD